MSDTREIGRFYVTFYCGPVGSGDRTRVTIGEATAGGSAVDTSASEAVAIAREILQLAHDRNVCGLDCTFHPCANDE